MGVMRFDTLLRVLDRYRKVNLRTVTQQTPRTKPLKGGVKTTSYLLLILPATTFCLGTWQVQRLMWKQSLIKQMEERMNAPPIPLPENPQEVEQSEYYKVCVRGTFDYSKEMIISPRQDYSPGLKPANTGIVPKQGAHLVVPFQLSNSNRRILVNRGYIPTEKIPQLNRQKGQVEGEVEITGVIRQNEPVSSLVQSMNKPMKYGYWLGRDIKKMSSLADTEPIFIDADNSCDVPGGPKGGQTIVQLRNKHFDYILIWYSLTLVMVFAWYKYASPHAAKMKALKRIQTIQSRF